MKQPDARCFVCGDPGYTVGGRMLKGLITYYDRNPRENPRERIHLYRFRGVRGTPTILVCSYCLRDLKESQKEPGAERPPLLAAAVEGL